VSAYVRVQGFFALNIDGGAVQAFYSLARRKFASPVAVKRLDIKSAVVVYRLAKHAAYICFDYWERDTANPPRHLIVAQFVVDPSEPPPCLRWERSFSVAFYSDSFLSLFPRARWSNLMARGAKFGAPTLPTTLKLGARGRKKGREGDKGFTSRRPSPPRAPER
jgi:hypothetical protein